jgi:hypothetical protein
MLPDDFFVAVKGQVHLFGLDIQPCTPAIVKPAEEGVGGMGGERGEEKEDEIERERETKYTRETRGRN